MATMNNPVGKRIVKPVHGLVKRTADHGSTSDISQVNLKYTVFSQKKKVDRIINKWTNKPMYEQ
jgi:hypothetical protein